MKTLLLFGLYSSMRSHQGFPQNTSLPSLVYASITCFHFQSGFHFYQTSNDHTLYYRGFIWVNNQFKLETCPDGNFEGCKCFRLVLFLHLSTGQNKSKLEATKVKLSRMHWGKYNIICKNLVFQLPTLAQKEREVRPQHSTIGWRNYFSLL